MSETTNDELDDAVLELVEEALDNEHPGAEKFGEEYDDPEWMDTLADHVAYRSAFIDEMEEIGTREARDAIRGLVSAGRLRYVTDDMWLDDKVTTNSRM